MTLVAGEITIPADQSDIDFLASDDAKPTEETPIPEETPEEEEKEEFTEEETEETEEEEETEEKPEEEEEEVPEDSKALVDKLRTIDPQVFKKIPYLRNIIYTQKEYSKLFADPNEARQVYEDHQAFSELSSDILNGKATSLLNAVGERNGALDRFAKNFLPALHAKNPDIFMKVGIPLVNGFLRGSLKEAERTGNKNLALAVKFLSRELNGNTEVPEEKVTADPEKEELKTKLAQKEQADNITYQSEVGHKCQYELNELIERSIRPDIKGMQREAIVERVTRATHQLLEQDENHIRIMNSLWKRARISGRDPQFKGRLFQTYINKAKEIVPTISTKVLAEFFPKNIKSKTKAQFPASGGGGKSSEQKLTSKNVDYRKSSDRDILEGRAVIKK